MPLTGYLSSKPNVIAQFFSDAFPQIQSITRPANAKLRAVTTIRPNLALHYPTIGTALDYRLRYYFGFTPPQDLVAWKGASGLETRTDTTVPVKQFFDEFTSQVERLEPWENRLTEAEENLLCRYCVVLALFEQIYRGPIHDSPLTTRTFDSVEGLLAISERHWIDDLRTLSWLFSDNYGDLTQHAELAILNPDFDGSADIGGADGDLIVDHCLIDIKCSVNPIIRSEFIYQLIGYALLDYSNRYGLESVGVYMARQGQLMSWPLDQLIRQASGNEQIDMEDLRTDFRKICVELADQRDQYQAYAQKDRERWEEEWALWVQIDPDIPPIMRDWHPETGRRHIRGRLAYAKSKVRELVAKDFDSLTKRQRDALNRAKLLLEKIESNNFTISPVRKPRRPS
jgi:hypothetical protein